MTIRADDPTNGQQWVEWKNNAGSDAPPGAIIRITGTTIISAGRTALTGDQPNTYGSQYRHAVNGPVTVKAGQYGICTLVGVFPALYDSGDGTPGFGEMWGPRSGTWKLKKNTGGFECVGAPTNTTMTLAPFIRVPMLDFYGKNAGSTITKGNYGTPINIYAGTLPGAETDTGLQMSNVLARFGDIPAGAMVQCRYLQTLGGTGLYWYAVQTDLCS